MISMIPLNVNVKTTISILIICAFTSRVLLEVTGMDLDYKRLGNRIREERLKLRLTQERLAEELGISDSYLGQLERGERSMTLETLVKLTNRFGTTIDYLMQDSVKIKDEELLNEWLQLMDGRSTEDKRMALDVVKVMFGHLDIK